MSILKRTLRILENIFTLHLPMLSFVTMFIVFLWQIFTRYILRDPPPWTVEISFMAFIYLVMTSACYATKEKAHVSFSLLHDKLPPRVRAWLTLLGNLLILAAFCVSVPTSVKYILSMERQVTGTLKIGLHIVYAPYLVFLFLTIVYSLRDAVRVVRSLKARKDNE